MGIALIIVILAVVILAVVAYGAYESTKSENKRLVMKNTQLREELAKAKEDEMIWVAKLAKMEPIKAFDAIYKRDQYNQKVAAEDTTYG